MASPITIHATHPSSHFFREHSTYSEEYQARGVKESAMGQYRAHPYQRELSRSPPKKGIDYRSTRFLGSTVPFQQAQPPSRGQNSMHPHRSIPPQFFSSPKSSNMASETSRIGVDRLVDDYSSSRANPSQRDAPQRGPPTVSPMRGPGEQAEPARLPGITSLLGLHPDSQRYEADHRYQPLPGAHSFQAPRYQGHSAASSMSSAFSEPVSPNSYGGHGSRSPNPQPVQSDDRSRSHAHHPYSSREESQAASHYEHGRAQNNPALSAHSQQSPSHHYPPPPPPSGPNTMLPPPPDPFYQPPPPHYPSQPRLSYSYNQSHTPQLSQPWDRPRIDSAVPLYDHPMGHGPGYGWGFPSHHANSMARKRRGNLPKEATKILKDWFGQHHDSPYPTEDEKQDLCRQTGLQISQVNNWFINARRRLPREDAKKLIDKEGKDRAGTEDSADSDVQMNGTRDSVVEGNIRYA